MEYLVYFLVYGVYVAAKAFQQLNVVFKKERYVPVMSYIMASVEVFIFSAIALKAVERDWLGAILLAFSIGTGAWVGCIISMRVHEKITGKGWG